MLPGNACMIISQNIAVEFFRENDICHYHVPVFPEVSVQALISWLDFLLSTFVYLSTKITPKDDDKNTLLNSEKANINLKGYLFKENTFGFFSFYI